MLGFRNKEPGPTCILESNGKTFETPASATILTIDLTRRGDYKQRPHLGLASTDVWACLWALAFKTLYCKGSGLGLFEFEIEF